MRSGNVPVSSAKIPPVGAAGYAPPEGQLTLADAVIRAVSQDNEDRPSVIVDNRETHSRVAEHLSDLGVKITLAQLSVGDYAIGERILIERKTAQDFVDTLVDRDLFGQMRDLADSSIRPVLIIEGGSLADLYELRNLHQNAIRNTLASIAVDFDVSILFTKDANETAEMIHAFARREAGSPGSPRSLHKAKTGRSGRETVEYILTAFPDVGPKAARDLLREFGSLRGVMTASKEQLMAVKGIGEKTAAGILQTPDIEWREK